MAEFKHGTITILLPDELMPPEKAGKMDALEVARTPKAPQSLRRVCNDAADSLEKAGDKFVAPVGITPETLRLAGRRSEEIEHVIQDCEVVQNVLRQANLIFDAEAYEQVRKVNDQVKAQAKHSPELWSIFRSLVEFFSKLRRRKIYPDPTEPPIPPNPGSTVPQT